MANETPGVDYTTAPTMTQAAIDVACPQGGKRYRLKRPGKIQVGKAVIEGPQLGGKIPSQQVRLSPETAAGFGDLLEVVP